MPTKEIRIKRLPRCQYKKTKVKRVSCEKKDESTSVEEDTTERTERTECTECTEREHALLIKRLKASRRSNTYCAFLDSSSTRTSKSQRASNSVLYETAKLDAIKQILRFRVAMDIQVSRKGGDFDLPGDAQVKVAEGAFMKKTTITMALIPPNRRHEMAPTMQLFEMLASNIYLLHSKSSLKAKIDLKLTCLVTKPVNLVALHKPPDEEWRQIKEASKVEDAAAEPVLFQGDNLTISTSEQGAYVLLEKPLEESFPVTPRGALLQSRNHHLISVRIPKRCTTFDGSCVLKILNIHESRMTRARFVYPRRTYSIECISPFYDFSFPGEAEAAVFKRPITLKLPLPEWCHYTDNSRAGEEEVEDIVVMTLNNQFWELLDTPLKISKSTVSFDTTSMTRFCIVRPRKDCRQRAHLSLPCLELCNQVIGGEILIFAMLSTKEWHLWAECVPQAHVVETISERVKKGFTYLHKVHVEIEEVDQRSRQSVSKRVKTTMFRDFDARETEESEKINETAEDVEFRNGVTYLLSLEGDLQFKEKSFEDSTNDVKLQFHEAFDDNYRLVEIEPSPELKEKAEEYFLNKVAAERKKAKQSEKTSHAPQNGFKRNSGTADSRLQNGRTDTSRGAYEPPLPSPTPLDSDSIEDFTEEDVEQEMAALVVNCSVNCRVASYESAFARYPLTVDIQDVIDYFAFEAPPEVDPEEEARALARENAKAAALLISSAEEALSTSEPALKKAKPKPSPSFQRLTTLTKQPQKISREPKVLSGRSLQVLSRHIQNGLTLAVHLNLPDSVITGIGFDSLSNLHCLNDVTYKVLLHWKRTFGVKEKEQMVPDLLEALKHMDLVAVAAVVADRHRNNSELTPGCFDF